MGGRDEETQDMAAFVRTEALVIGAWIVTIALITWVVLGIVRDYAGRPTAWIVGLVILLLASFALLRLRKKV
jgi:hypothetical protein